MPIQVFRNGSVVFVVKYTFGQNYFRRKKSGEITKIRVFSRFDWFAI